MNNTSLGERYLKVLLLMISWAFIIEFAGCIAPRKAPLELYARAIQENKVYDAVIVPGIPFKNDRWDSVMKARVIWAWVLYKNGIAKNFIFSGDAVYSPFKESIIMALYAEKLGIPREHIYYETKAKHSTENVYYSYLEAKKHGFKSLALATDPLQSYLLKRFLERRFGTPIDRLPFIMDTVRVYSYLNPTIDPHSAKVNEDDFEPIDEEESFITRLRGTLGHDIKWRQYPNGKVDAL
jgi:uncharacterized SAM-binding protein YcdF (DUF218 family)